MAGLLSPRVLELAYLRGAARWGDWYILEGLREHFDAFDEEMWRTVFDAVKEPTEDPFGLS